MGAQIAATTLAPHLYSIFYSSTQAVSSLGVWQVPAAEEEANRFNPANVFSMLKRQSEFDNK